MFLCSLILIIFFFFLFFGSSLASFVNVLEELRMHKVFY